MPEQNDQDAAWVFDSAASIYQDKYMDVGIYAHCLDKFCEYLPSETSEILDIACGPGNVARYLLDKDPKLDILGIDLAPNMLELARNNVPEAFFVKMDCRDISDIDVRFDGIVCSFCLPYLKKYEATQLIGDCAELLNEGGILYLSTKEADPSLSGVHTSSSGSRLFINYYTYPFLEKLLLDSGFTILHAENIENPANPSADIRDLVILAKKQG